MLSIKNSRQPQLDNTLIQHVRLSKQLVQVGVVRIGLQEPARTVDRFLDLTGLQFGGRQVGLGARVPGLFLHNGLQQGPSFGDAVLAQQLDGALLDTGPRLGRPFTLKGQHDVETAIRAYTDAAAAISAFRPGGSFFVSLIGDALHLCATSKKIGLKIRLLKDVFVPDLKAVDESIEPLDALYRTLPRMADTITRMDRLLPIVALSMADLLADVPPLVERRIILQATDILFPRGSTSPMPARLAAAAAILMAQSGNLLTLDDVADIAERLAAAEARIYFKPQPDGSGHWTLRLEIADGVVISLVQLDDSPRTAITTTVLALLLSGLDRIIRQRLLDAERIPRQEAIINVASRKVLEAQPGSERLKLGDMPKGFAGAESTDVTRSDQPPIVVVCEDQFPTPWRPNEHALSDVHLLFGELLRVLVAHLLARAVEPEVLLPKIGSIIRRIGYRGPAVHAHPRE